MQLRDNAARGVLWTTIQSWVKRLVQLLTFVVLARLLDPSDFGVVALATVFIAFITVIQESGFAQAIIQREDLDDLHLDTAVWFSLTLGALFMVVLNVVAAPVSGLLDSARLEPVLRLLSLTFVLTGLKSTPTAILQRQMRFKVLALRDTLAAVAGGLTGVLMALNDSGVYALVGQQLAQATVAVIALWTASRWRPAPRFSWRHFRQLYSFGVKVLGINVMGLVGRQSDNLLIGAFLGNVALGVYTVGYRILTMFTEMFIYTLSRVTRPTFARLQTEPERLRRALYASSRMSGFVAFPVFLGISAVAPEVVEVFFGARWADAVPVMRILGFVGALHAIAYLLGSVMVAMGRPDVSLRLSLVNAGLNVIGFATAIAAGWGIIGVAAAYTIRAYVMAPVHLWSLDRLLGVSYRRYGGAVAPSAASAVLMWLGVNVVTSLAGELDAVVRLLLGVGVGVIIYLGAILVLARDVPREAADFAKRARKRPTGALEAPARPA